MPELPWEYFEDHWAFDENWRDWLDDPPVGWRPPENTPLFWRVVDMTERDGWVVRLDVWMGAEGIHMHFRWVLLMQVPDKAELDAWHLAGSPVDKLPKPTYVFTKKAVAGFVIRWFEMGLLQDIMLDPDKRDDNGKGADLTDLDKREL